MDVRHIAELVILQCIEDLWNQKDVSESADFFQGEGFSLCAEIAGIDLYGKQKLLAMVVRGMKTPFKQSGGAYTPDARLPQKISRAKKQDERMSAVLGPQ